MGYGAETAMTPAFRAAPAGSPRRTARTRMRRARWHPAVLPALAASVDLLAVVLATLAARMSFGATDALADGATLGLLAVAVGSARGDYAAETLLGPPGGVWRVLQAWLLAVALASVVSVLRESPARPIDGITVLGGTLLLPAARSLLTWQARRWAAAGHLIARRVMLVGGAQEVAAFMARDAAQAGGRQVVAAAVLRDDLTTLDDDLSLAVATARLRRPDGLILLLPWSEPDRIARSLEPLRLLPVSIHLGPPGFEDAASLAVDAAGWPLVKHPLSPAERRLKRVFDLVVASAALALLAPVLAAIAVAIKLDSRGPVFFRQRRTGYNGQPFRILKFRSMGTMEDSAALRQATRRDSRVTRVGRLLRRSSLDELPQLVNVLRGEMSLIGPRPHALAHDLAFGRTHRRYPRRHAVKPGITGLAQVSGFRGETDTADKLEGRVRHDLAYVDNWSAWLDFTILLRTVFSPQTFRNAH